MHIQCLMIGYLYDFHTLLYNVCTLHAAGNRSEPRHSGRIAQIFEAKIAGFFCRLHRDMTRPYLDTHIKISKFIIIQQITIP